MNHEEWLKQKEAQARSGSSAQKTKPSGYNEWKASKAGPSTTIKPAGYESNSSARPQYTYPGFNPELKRKADPGFRTQNRRFWYQGKTYAELSSMLTEMEDGEEKDWLSAYASSVDYDEKSRFDLDAGQKEVEGLEAILGESKYLSRWSHDDQDTNRQNRLAYIRQQYGDERAIEALISEKRQYLNQARHIQEGITLSGVAGNADFEDSSSYVSTKGDRKLPWLTTQYGMGYDDLTYEYINNQDGIRDEINNSHRSYSRTTSESPFQAKGYDYLTEDEIAIYNYHYAKDGKETAEKYLDSIQETLNLRKATSMYEGMEDKTALELAFGMAAGLDQFASGMKSLVNDDDYIAQSAFQMASGMVRNDLADDGPNLPGWMGGASIGQVGYDTVTTTTNMAPSILTSIAMNFVAPGSGAIVGTSMMGASAAGSAYQEALNAGYDKDQARGYSALVGGSEALLGYALGGISSLGGKVSNNVIAGFLNKVDNAFLRTVGKLGGNMLSEFSEEYLQEVLTPVFQNLAFDTAEDVKLISADALYAGILGALTAGIMEGPSTISGEVGTYKTGRQLQEADISAQRLAEIGSTFSADTVAHQLAGRVDESTGAYTMGRLFNEIGAEVTEANKADIRRSLVSKGMPENTASKTAEVFAKVVAGGKFTDTQIAVIEANEVLAKTVSDVIINPNSTVNQRSKGYNEVLMALAQEKAAPDATSEAAAQADTDIAPTPNTVDAKKEVGADSHHESSTEGKTILRSTGETIGIKEISSIKDGKMFLKLDDGRTVDASEVGYASQDEALVYETVADMGTNAMAADMLVKAYTPGVISAQDYTRGIKEAYTYGQYNYPVQEVASGPFSSMLTEHQRQTAYKLGQIFRGKQIAKEQATVRNNRTAAKNATTVSRKETVGKIYFDRKGRTFDDVREVSLKTMEQLSAALGIEFYVFESYVNESGKRVYTDENGNEATAPNGFYDPMDGSIHIDLNAGIDGKGTMLFTIAHELTHFIRHWSPAKFKVLANFLNEQYGVKGKSVSALVEEQIAKAKRNDRTISQDEAYEEVVADSMESMLIDGNVVQVMTDLKKQDKSLWQKICDWFKDLAADLKAIVDAYTGKTPDSVEGKLVADMQDVIVVLESLYADALVDASENRQAAPKAEKNTTQEGGAKFQTRNVNGGQVVWIESNILKENKGLPVHQFVANYIAEHIGEVYTIIESGQKVYIGRDLPGEYTQSKYTKAILRNNSNISRAKNRASANLGEMIEIATNRRWEKTKHHGSKDAKYGMYRYDTRFGFPVKDTSGRVTGANIFRAELVIRNASDGKKYLYDIVSIKKDTASSDWLTQRVTSAAEKTAGQKGVVFRNNVTQQTTEVNKKFSSRDSNGNNLTAEQQEYFKDSKVRDEQGRLLVMYHGTPSGRHTTFRSGTYFTPDRQYADVYQNLSASSLSVKREQGVPKTYEVYLNITKPFDTRNDTEREIFMQEYYRQWGTGAPLSDSGLPDWTDGMDLQEFIEEMGYDYDGLILDEGATGGYGMEVKSRGLSYVTFNSNQVKNVDNTTPTSDPDIRFSDRDPEQQRVNRALEKENAKLREDVTSLKELLKLQRSVTGGKKFTKTSVEAAATKLMKDAGARGTKAELVSLLNGFYEYIAAGEELTWEGMVEQAQPVVRWLQANEHTKKQTSEYAADILRELRGTRIALDDLQKKEAAYQYGSFNEFRKKAMGSIIITNTGTPLDVQWIELSRLHPNIFNPETTSNDMPAALLDAISTLRNMPPESEFGYDREMAAQDLLHQVYDSYWSVSTLHTVADVKQREINRLKSAHHQRMADLREAHRKNTAKLKQQHSADLERVRKEMRAAANAKQQKIIDRYQESRKQGVESRKKTAMRHKIQGVVKELNDLLLNGTKDRHVPIGLQKAVAEALDAVNMDTVGADERLAKLQAEIVRAKTPGQVAEIAKKFDHVREMDNRMQSHLKALHDAYDEIKNDEDPLMSNVYDDGLSTHMMTLIVEVGDTPLRDMTMHQLECVYDVYKIVLTTVRNANKSFKAAKNESIASLGNMAMMEVRSIGGKKQYGMKGMDGVKSFAWNNLKPVYAFEHIGSKTLIELFNNVRAGEDVWAVDVTEAREYYLDKAKRYKYNTWDFAKQHPFKSTSGMDFNLNLEQIMSLYAYSKRDQAADHLRRGGIVIDETTEVIMKTKLGIPVKFNPTEATAYNISDMTLAEIVGTLTPEQKGFVDDMQDYLSTVMCGKGNEVSLAMYGIKLFKDKFYFPLKSAPQFMAKAKEQQQGEVKIKNSGFSKQTVKKASNPIVLTPFMNVWADHVNEMSMYHAFVLPMEDFYRVYNFNTPTSEGTAIQSVEMTIQNAYGKGAIKYIDQLLKDLNGGARTDSTTGFINKMMGLFKKGAVFASMSVVIQQPSAIARAAALVDAKYFIGPKVDKKRHKALWDEVKQYAPVAIIKEMGYFDTNMGSSTQDFIMGKEYSGFGEKMKAVVSDSNYRDEILSKAPALADELAWCGIWEAVKRETMAKNPGIKANTEEFLQRVGQRFTEIITKTQVYDSVLSRSALMRSKDTGMKMATAFMAEPTTSINMIADSLLQGKRGNRKHCRRAIGAVIASQILNSILVSFVYAGRDDDEDETYLEKYLGTLTGELLDSLNPATYIPFIKDIISIVQGYDVERSDMAVISDIWNAWQKLDSDQLSPYRKVEGFAGSIAQIFGLPVKNIMRDARTMYQTIQSFMSGQKTTSAGIGYAVKSAAPKWLGGGDVSNQKQLYEAYLSGDKAQISRVEGRFKNQSAINTAIRAALRENDSRIRVAAEARVSSNLTEYTRLAKEIISESHFSQDNVIAAINAEINAMSKSDGTSTPKALGLYKAEDFATAISGGDSSMASAIRYDIIQTAQKNGKTAEEAEKSFISSAKASMKELFLAKGITETQAINALIAYCGDTGEEARKHVAEWKFDVKKSFPDTYVDDAWVTEYYEEVESSGISIEVFVDYRNQVKGITGEGKKAGRMAVIDSMPISNDQKDALYYAEGWAASKLYEAPWH